MHHALIITFKYPFRSRYFDWSSSLTSLYDHCSLLYCIFKHLHLAAITFGSKKRRREMHDYPWIWAIQYLWPTESLDLKEDTVLNFLGMLSLTSVFLITEVKGIFSPYILYSNQHFNLLSLFRPSTSTSVIYCCTINYTKPYHLKASSIYHFIYYFLGWGIWKC